MAMLKEVFVHVKQTGKANYIEALKPAKLIKSVSLALTGSPGYGQWDVVENGWKYLPPAFYWEAVGAVDKMPRTFDYSPSLAVKKFGRRMIAVRVSIEGSNKFQYAFGIRGPSDNPLEDYKELQMKNCCSLDDYGNIIFEFAPEMKAKFETTNEAWPYVLADPAGHMSHAIIEFLTTPGKEHNAMSALMGSKETLVRHAALNVVKLLKVARENMPLVLD